MTQKDRTGTQIKLYEINMFYLLKLLQQLFKARSLQLTTDYIHDSNHTMKCINLHKDVKTNKQHGEKN